jgi:hypothetical protein
MNDENNKFAESGKAMSSWLPIGNTRKAIFFVLLILGFLGLLDGNKQMLIYFPIAALFSPRIVGECLYFLGRMKRILSGK